LVSQARAVKKYAPTLVEKVRDGFALNKAYEMIDAQVVFPHEGITAT
jgi:hypothetical protein